MKEAGTNLLHWLLSFSMVFITRNSTDESLMWLISQENHNWWWLLFNLDHWLSKEKSVLLLREQKMETYQHTDIVRRRRKVRREVVAGTSQYKSDSDYFIKSECCDQVDQTGPGSFNSDQQHVVLSANCSQLTVRLFRRFYHWFSVGIFIAELLDYDNMTNVKFRLSPSPHTPRHSSLIWSGENIWLIYFGKFDPLQSSVSNCKVNSLMWQHSQVTNI